MDEALFQDRMRRIEELIQAIQVQGNPVVRASAVEMVRLLLEAHRAVLEKMLACMGQYGEPGQVMLNAFVQDNLISRFLLLHGLHPVNLEVRIRQALDQIGPALRTHEVEVHLVAIGHEVVRLRVTSGCDRVYQLLESAILEAAPDVLRMEFVDEVAPAGRLPSLPLVRDP